MSRYIYTNLYKIIFGSILLLVFAPSFVYMICSFVLNNNLDHVSLIISIFCIGLWIVVFAVIHMLNKSSKNKIIFESGKIIYKGETVYLDRVSLRYFKFYISITEPILVIPKLIINGTDLYLKCYLSNKDIKRLEKLNYTIKKI